MPHAYTEGQLVEQPAIGLFAELGWSVAEPPPHAGVAGEPRDAGLLGRETKGAASEQMDTLENKTDNLRRTRDLLLPRLLSGQVELKVN